MNPSAYEHFIPQNTAARGAQRIGVYNVKGNRVGQIPLGPLTPPNPARRLYSFLCVSDSHIMGSTETEDGTADLIRALTYAENDPDIAFTTICGDVIDSGSEYYFEKFSSLVDKYAAKPVYAITGNHECSSGPVSNEQIQASFGRTINYSFPHNGDMFIMLGEYGWTDAAPFTDYGLDFLESMLTANRNKRCFVFFHLFSFLEGDSGQPVRTFYSGGDIFALSSAGLAQKERFLSLLRQYKNTVWFHGHSHAMFELQAVAGTTVYSEACGYRSVHIPSLAKPKDFIDGSAVTVTAGSQGYVVDVYPDGIHLRGRDFAKGAFLPIASYWIDTTT